MDALEAEIEHTLRSKTVTEWVEHFDSFGIPAGPVLGLAEVLEHPQLKAREMVTDSHHPKAGEIRMTGIVHRLSDTPGAIRRPPPQFAQHTVEILSELGYAAEDIHALRSSGAVFQGES